MSPGARVPSSPALVPALVNESSITSTFKSRFSGLVTLTLPVSFSSSSEDDEQEEKSNGNDTRKHNEKDFSIVL
jgi:hypothetical protein